MQILEGLIGSNLDPHASGCRNGNGKPVQVESDTVCRDFDIVGFRPHVPNKNFQNVAVANRSFA